MKGIVNSMSIFTIKLLQGFKPNEQYLKTRIIRGFQKNKIKKIIEEQNST